MYPGWQALSKENLNGDGYKKTSNEPMKEANSSGLGRGVGKNSGGRLRATQTNAGILDKRSNYVLNDRE